MANFQDSFLSGGNIEFIEALYARYLEDPSAVDPSWRDLFSQQARDGKPLYAGGRDAAARTNGNGKHLNGGNGQRGVELRETERPAPSMQIMGLQARVDQTVYAFRLRGHLLSQLDPLGFPRPALEHVADLGMVSENHFTSDELEQWVDSADVFEERRVRLKDLLARLRQTYCHHIGVEYMQILDSVRRRWIGNSIERTGNRTGFSVEEQRRILTKLSYAEGFESFLHVKYQGSKRFSIDGGEVLVPMIDTFLEVGGSLGICEVVVGMAHRGRLNVLTNVLGKQPDQIFSEFDEPTDFKQFLNRGDVKYHQGFSSDYLTQAGKKIHLSLAFNPSHLEVVYPVVEGRVRAKQDRLAEHNRHNCVPLVIHGDAAFSGQGLIAETLNLSQLPGYSTGGTVHIVINNQVGYTTEAEQGRSSLYCTAVSHLVDIPVFHVNGDDPEACAHVMKVATEYRQKFHTDVVIDLVCYRRYGHNEGDEPAYTQPMMYERIRARPTVRTLYSEELAKAGRISLEEAESLKQKAQKEFQEAHARAKAQNRFQEPSFIQGIWKGYHGGPDKDAPHVDTGIDVPKLKQLLTQITTLPSGFTAHPNLMRESASLKGLIPARLAMARGEQPLDWGAGEALAFATLLSEGYSLRLTGQDTERGTFAHRHGVLHDYKTGEQYVPLAQLSPRPRACVILNSPLSEMGCMGFEFGYSLDCPDGLIAWEAQFGDFANNGQVIIDQFIAACEDKWKRLSGLTLLLPHGYEGMGPEHSSARLERFLELCAEDNLQVCYPTTPAQIFHLLRRQVVRPLRKPLIVMTPKSLLRSVGSPLEAFAQGGFKRLISDTQDIDPAKVTRLLLCSGKVYYDLVKGREKAKDATLGIVRLEQLYPFPEAELSAVLAKMPKLAELYWVQEEPKNNGAWSFMIQYLQTLISDLPGRPRFGFIGRVESASPATGFHHTHDYEQQLIVEEAIARGQGNGR